MADEKNALMLVTEMIKDGKLEMKHVEKRILEKTGQKKNLYWDPIKAVDKNKVQKLELFRGQSFGFCFERRAPQVWACRGENCEVEIRVEEDFSLEDPEHFKR